MYIISSSMCNINICISDQSSNHHIKTCKGLALKLNLIAQRSMKQELVLHGLDFQRKQS